MGNKSLIILGVFLIAIIVGISGCTSSGSSSNPSKSSAPPFQLENLQVTSTGYGGYSIKGDLTPTKDISYLEMVTIWYDSSGAVIYRNPIAWNMNDLKSGQKVRVSTNDYISSDKETPSKVDLLVFDGPFSGGKDSSAIYRTSLSI